MSRRPAVSRETVATLLETVLGEAPTVLARIDEGLESQAFACGMGGEAFVLRIATSRRGFEKDRWAAEAAGGNMPVPAVEFIGDLDDGLAYCVTRRLPGITLEALQPDEVAPLTAAVQATWRALADVDVSVVDGFGDFDPEGRAPERTWRDVLVRTLDAAEEDDDLVVLDAYAALVERCPEERSLVHGDFGSNNVLAQAGSVTGVLDWEHALVGDPLYDVATARFWAPDLTCMALQATHFDRELASLPDYEERVRCYALRIGIEEAREARRHGELAQATWAAERCRELLLTL